MQCPYCGVTLRKGAKKCPVCGGWQAGAAPGAAAPAPGVPGVPAAGPNTYSNMAGGLAPAYSNRPAGPLAGGGTGLGGEAGPLGPGAGPASEANPAGPALPPGSEAGLPGTAAMQNGKAGTAETAAPSEDEAAPSAPSAGHFSISTAGTPPAPPPLPAAKGRRRWLIAAGGLLAAAALGHALFLLLRPAPEDPKQALRRAVDATATAWAQNAAEATAQLDPTPILAGLYAGPAKVDLTLGLPMAQGAALLGPLAGGAGEGSLLTVSATARTDLPARRADIAFTAGPGGLLQGSLALDGDLLALELPALYAGSYGLHSETFGADYQASNAKLLADMLGGLLPGWQDGLQQQWNALMTPELSFNLFDLLPPAPQPAGPLLSEADRARLAELEDALWQQATVEEEKRPQTLTLDGRAVTCRVYTAQVPGPALAGLMDAAAGPLLDSLADPFIEQALPALAGQGAGQIMQSARQMTAGALDILRQRLAGAAGLTFYLAEGRVVRAQLAAEANDFLLELTSTPTAEPTELRLAASEGGLALMDLALTLAIGPAPASGTPAGAAASGGGAGRDITFALSLGAQVQAGAPAAPMLEAGLNYRPGQALDNFSAALGSPPAAADFSLAAAGTLHLDQAARTLQADLYDITAAGCESTARYTLALEIAPEPELALEPPETTLLLDMGLFDMGMLAVEISRGLGRLGFTG